MAAAEAAVPPIPAATWFGQPRGLTVLFLTEMWEKFSFFGMRVLLVYYMTKQLMIGQEKASLIYGLYTGFVYFTPIIGGVIADRWLGRKRAVIIGGLIMAAGHFMMTFEPLFYGALVAIAVGNGLFLPSLPSQVGDLYPQGDPRRASAYNIYYVGINLGAVLAIFACGWIGETFGWHYGFALAGIGMLTGLLVYTAGGRYLPRQSRQPPAEAATASARFGLGGMIAVLFGVWAAVVIFRGAYEQIGNTLALWADQGVDRRVFGNVSIPMTWFQMFNPLLVFLLTPFLVAHWTRRAARGRETSPVAKMAMGAGGVAAAFLLLAVVAASAGEGGRASWLWFAAFFVLYTLGELYILPTGLGLFARLAPAGMGATAIAAWFFAAFAGNLLAGALGTLWSRLSPPAFFAAMAGVAALSGLSLLLVHRRSGALAASAPDPRMVGETLH
jgi:POT family proton-dependent oligopeptide transporter